MAKLTWVGVTVGLARHSLDAFTEQVVIARSENGPRRRSRETDRAIQEHVSVVFEFDVTARLERP